MTSQIVSCMEYLILPYLLKKHLHSNLTETVAIKHKDYNAIPVTQSYWSTDTHCY